MGQPLDPAVATDREALLLQPLDEVRRQLRIGDRPTRGTLRSDAARAPA